jgi:phosphoribosyl 1,2-cyclic phosphodiesterase
LFTAFPAFGKMKFICSDQSSFFARLMSLYITSLNSGSNGNCYYIGNDNEAVLVDAGISCREVETRMKRLGLDMKKVKAVFISHEHTDHIKGIEILSKKHQLPVYITDATRRHGRVKLQKHLSFTFSASSPVQIGEIAISSFAKLHDAADPHSFLISCKGVNVGVFTDIGAPCNNLIRHFNQCHAAFLESNYDELMLETGGYPYYLKKRITGGNGHLSNKQALDLFQNHRPEFMTHLLLSHLSQNNNDPKLVEEMFKTNAGRVEMIIASRHSETAVYHISAEKPAKQKPSKTKASQLQFAFS